MVWPSGETWVGVNIRSISDGWICSFNIINQKSKMSQILQKSLLWWNWRCFALESSSSGLILLSELAFVWILQHVSRVWTTFLTVYNRLTLCTCADASNACLHRFPTDIHQKQMILCYTVTNTLYVWFIVVFPSYHHEFLLQSGVNADRQCVF